jgi:hypothetical protein
MVRAEPMLFQSRSLFENEILTLMGTRSSDRGWIVPLLRLLSVAK